tara:strand:+ start:2026 stop:2769 length:744 start_codon:yes stop_codon:yes gene_type:complete
MRKFALKYTLEFIVIVLGITISYWINDIQIQNQESNKEKIILNSILSDIEQIELYINARKKTLSSDSIWMDYLIKNWDKVNIDSTAKQFSKNRYDASFHNLFLDFREFHPPIATLEMVTSDGSFSIIKNDLIKRRINSIVYLSKEQLIKNSEVEIDLQLSFKERLMVDEDIDIVNMLNATQFELKNRFDGSENYYEESKNELKIILEKDYARNYLNLKFRHRYFVQLFLNNFSNQVSELKTLILNNI